MKNKGFTLIELLAVILILGIIALIAIPTVSSVVEQSRKGAFETTVSQLIDSIEQDCMEKEVSGEEKIYEYIIEDGHFNTDIAVKGDLPDEGTFVIKYGTCEVARFDVNDGNYAAIKNEEKEIEIIKVNDTNTYENGTAIYYNPETNTKCTKEEYDTNLINHNSNKTPTFLKNGCMKWYTFLDDGSNKINMILDHNTTAIVAWNSDGDSTVMKEVKETLEDDTKTWNSYLNPRLISVFEVVDIVGNTTFDINSKNVWSNEFYFDSEASEEKVNTYAWLFNYLYNSILVGFGNYNDNTYYSYLLNGELKRNAAHGYWTSSRAISGDYIYIVDKRGGVYINFPDHNGDHIYNGVRPVITVYKSVIK